MSTCFVGEIRLFAFKRVPINWVACSGQSLKIYDYQALYSLIGTVYGGDGQTTFNVPNLNGRLPIGQGQGAGSQVNYQIGRLGGAETVTLTEAQIPAHLHHLIATSAPSTSPAPGPTLVPGAIVPNTVNRYQRPPTPALWNGLYYKTVGVAGNGAAHNNIMPGTGMLYCMATLGEYPVQQ
jgi:microcystin-dependent protein